jgi:ABC-type glutathione transport system ATPase component
MTPPSTQSPATLAPAIEVRDLVRHYTRPRTSLRRPPDVVEALRGVSFTVAKGARFGIVGESGSGKSTLLRLLCGLDRPTSGTLRLDGRVQIVFQDPVGSLNPRMRVGDIVCEPLRGMSKTDRDARAAELLEAVGMPADAARRFPHQFSGGQRQRISIARALAPDPDILLADEPVSALDVSVRAQVLNLLDDLVTSRGLTLVLVSHDLAVVRHVCSETAVMKDGEIVESGPTHQVHDDPQHPYTRRLLAAIPTLEKALAGVTADDLLDAGPISQEDPRP